MGDDVLIFDVCDVLLKTSFQNVFRFLHPDLESVPKINKDFEYDQFSRGKICSFDYYEHFKDQYELTIDYREFCVAWNKFFVGEMDGMEPLLAHLSRGNQLYGLSNLNIIHCMFAHDNYQNILRYFTKIFYSFELGLRKPEPDVFLATSSLLNRFSGRKIFIDDNQKNIQVARSLGLSAIHFENAISFQA